MHTHRNGGSVRWPLRAAALSTGLFLVAAAPASLPDLEEFGSVDLSRAGDVSRLDFRLEYPGLELKIVNGQTLNDTMSPDCLALVGPFFGSAPPDKLRELADRLEISDGAGVYFDDPAAETNQLEPRLVDGTYVWFLEDLATYVTGVRVVVKDGRSFESTLREVFPDEDYQGVSLQFSRGCRAVGD
ncbi:MAG: hypothetical protein Q8P18_15400 [Pseudomonadota bacterium]|nr:hypothetical protein [Pseudomonadota bacterium]